MFNLILSILVLVAAGWLFIKIANAGFYAAISVGGITFGWALWYFNAYFYQVVTGGILLLCVISLYYGFKYHPDNEVTSDPANPADFPKTTTEE